MTRLILSPLEVNFRKVRPLGTPPQTPAKALIIVPGQGNKPVNIPPKPLIGLDLPDHDVRLVKSKLSQPVYHYEAGQPLMFDEGLVSALLVDIRDSFFWSRHRGAITAMPQEWRKSFAFFVHELLQFTASIQQGKASDSDVNGIPKSATILNGTPEMFVFRVFNEMLAIQSHADGRLGGVERTLHNDLITLLTYFGQCLGNVQAVGEDEQQKQAIMLLLGAILAFSEARQTSFPYTIHIAEFDNTACRLTSDVWSVGERANLPYEEPHGLLGFFGLPDGSVAILFSDQLVVTEVQINPNTHIPSVLCIPGAVGGGTVTIPTNAFVVCSSVLGWMVVEKRCDGVQDETVEMVDVCRSIMEVRPYGDDDALVDLQYRKQQFSACLPQIYGSGGGRIDIEKMAEVTNMYAKLCAAISVRHILHGMTPNEQNALSPSEKMQLVKAVQSVAIDAAVADLCNEPENLSSPAKIKVLAILTEAMVTGAAEALEEARRMLDSEDVLRLAAKDTMRYGEICYDLITRSAARLRLWGDPGLGIDERAFKIAAAVIMWATDKDSLLLPLTEADSLGRPLWEMARKHKAHECVNAVGFLPLT